jgi:hypothetical protein
VGSYNTPGYAYSVAVQGNYAFVADNFAGIQILDVSVPASPTLAASFTTLGSATDISIDGSLAAISNAEAGMILADISDPTNPRIVDWFQTADFTWAIQVSGNTVYGAAGSGGLAMARANPTMMSVAMQDSATITATVPAALPGGPYHVLVTNPAGLTEAGSLANGFFVSDDGSNGDLDSDGVFNLSDNCIAASNTDQRDSNQDGFGNVCDPDLDNNLVVDNADLALLLAVLGQARADADNNGDGTVDSLDLGFTLSYYGGVPGPSGQ